MKTEYVDFGAYLADLIAGRLPPGAGYMVAPIVVYIGLAAAIGAAWYIANRLTE